MVILLHLVQISILSLDFDVADESIWNRSRRKRRNSTQDLSLFWWWVSKI